MDEQPNELDRAREKRRRAVGRHASALVHKKLSPGDPDAAQSYEDAVGANREAQRDYQDAADAALAPIKADIDEMGAGRLPKEREET